MGSVVGCANNLCLQKELEEKKSIDILPNNNFENLYTVNSIGKNELIKPILTVQEKENDEIKEISNEKEYKEKEEDEKIKKEREDVLDLNSKNSEKKESRMENNKDIIIKINNQKRISIEKNLSNNEKKYKENIDKIILIQRNYRKYKERNKNKINPKLEVKKKGDNLSLFKGMKKPIPKQLSLDLKKKDDKFSKNGGNETEEIISIDNSHNLIQKKSSKALNNFKAMELLKHSMVLSNNQTNLFKMNPEIKNYFNILGDFGEKLSMIKQTNYPSKKFKLTQISLSKNKREILSKKTKDNIKGNFIQKNEKVVRYQGGFLKKTRKKNGFGIITWSDGSKLKGNFQANELNGICRFYNYKYKSTFIGEYFNNQPKGFGVYSVKGFSLQGYWDSENLNGIAIEVWEDGTYYQGEYRDNKKNGIGLYRWPDGTIYQGEFRDGQMNGKGIILYSNDCIFSGEIENGYMNGYGNFSWGNGSMYIGYYIQDIKNGFGIYIWDQKNFLCYIGFWEMGKQQGIGAKVNGNKIKYCIWNKGKISLTLKGLYEIDKYLTGLQKGYYQFFTPSYITKLKMNNFYNLDDK